MAGHNNTFIQHIFSQLNPQPVFFFVPTQLVSSNYRCQQIGFA